MAKKKTNKSAQIHPLGKKLLWVEEPKNLKNIIKALAVFCGLLLVINIVFGLYGHFPIEKVPGFYAASGFLAFAFIIISTKYLREVIGRSEDYYAPQSVDAEPYPEEGLDKKEHGDV